MKKLVLKRYSKNLTALALVWAIMAMPLIAFGQTRVSMPRNKYKVRDDVQAGQQAAQQVEQQMPILNDYESTRYVQNVGERLVNAIPAEFQHPEFRYNFKIVNASDINAFALPGGPMYVNRGMIEAARTEGEMAGVMAHEISHVALRHGTAQATKASNPSAQLPAIGGAILGAILGGTIGGIAQGVGQLGSAAIMTKYSREYETQADILGAQIMARAGYNPRDLANMFRTIEQQSGGGSRGPEWLSSHPNPGNRYAVIEREADMLRVSERRTNSAEFAQVQNRLRGGPRAQTMEEIARNQQNNRTNNTVNGRYENRVGYPSTRVRGYNLGVATVNAPSNWEMVNQSNTEIWLAPQGAYGQSGITHGTLIGLAQGGSRSLQQDTQNYINSILQSNNYLQARTNYARTSIGGRSGLGVVLSGRSPITNQTEVATVYTTQLRNGQMLYVVTVVPENEASRYNNAFRNMIRSIRINDR